MILGFHSKQLTERGTEVALFDYAFAAQRVLGHEARVFVPAASEKIIPSVRRKFEAHFDVVLYRSPREISCDALYVIKRGKPGRITDTVPELNHAFMDASQPHGHRFAAVSDWVARTARHEIHLPRGRMARLPRLRKLPVVPHIVELPDVADDRRSELGIPEDAVVFGRHGGTGTFSIEFVREAVRAALDRRDDIWFLFLNTDVFVDHERVLHLPVAIDRTEVRRFVNTCDYMLYAGLHGETFGLAVAEFALVGAPVIAPLMTPRLAHVDLLPGELLLGYRSYDDVLGYLRSLPRRVEPLRSDIRERYGAERVMARFDEVFLR